MTIAFLDAFCTHNVRIFRDSKESRKGGSHEGEFRRFPVFRFLRASSHARLPDDMRRYSPDKSGPGGAT